MALDAKHPQYQSRFADWIVMRDAYEGEERVKSKETTYLPATKGMQIDGMGKTELGYETYKAYLLRSVFPDYVKDAVEVYIGLLHQKSATIQLPQRMEFLRENCTANGESILQLLRRINEQQLVTGRLGLLLDMPRNPDPTNPMPYVSLYVAEAIVNWDDGQRENGKEALNLVVLNESTLARKPDFTWDTLQRYRVLSLGTLEGNEAKGLYTQGTFEQAGGTPIFAESDMKPPMLRGQTLDRIPFVFVNSKDLVPDVDAPPLRGLARDCFTIYRGEADYRQNLFMQGQDTLVTIGEKRRRVYDPTQLVKDEDEPIRTGAGSHLQMEMGGDAKYIGVRGEGLSEQREALSNDRERAETRSGQLINTKTGDESSGAALQTRVAAQTATLHQIALSGAAGLEKILKQAAEWLGADPNEVKISPNLEFAKYDMTGKNLVELMTAKKMGAPITLESIHALMIDRGLTKMDYTTEDKKLKAEPPLPDFTPDASLQKAANT